jgi:anti-sigma regulatory factor (Ser/Thr protein kinase)
VTATPILDTFRHEAMLYDGLDAFVDGASAFVRDGHEAGEPVLVVTGSEKLVALRDAVGDTRGGAPVLYADMAEVGGNPARIIPAWREFVAAHASGGRRVRGIGEPIWAARPADEVVECQRHEALLNLAFADAPAWWLLCPYDLASLDGSVIEEARRTHPFVTDGNVSTASPLFAGAGEWASSFDAPLSPAPRGAATVTFGRAPLGSLRKVVSHLAEAAGLPAGKVDDLVLAVNELATNSQRHGGGGGVLRVWAGGGEVVAEVADRGHINDPLVGRRHPPADGEGGRGIWLVNQLCDFVELRSSAAGTVVRLHMRLG